MKFRFISRQKKEETTCANKNYLKGDQFSQGQRENFDLLDIFALHRAFQRLSDLISETK